jgi:hypothetical protein
MQIAPLFLTTLLRLEDGGSRLLRNIVTCLEQKRRNPENCIPHGVYEDQPVNSVKGNIL